MKYSSRPRESHCLDCMLSIYFYRKEKDATVCKYNHSRNSKGMLKNSLLCEKLVFYFISWTFVKANNSTNIHWARHIKMSKTVSALRKFTIWNPLLQDICSSPDGLNADGRTHWFCLGLSAEGFLHWWHFYFNGWFSFMSLVSI